MHKVMDINDPLDQSDVKDQMSMAYDAAVTFTPPPSAVIKEATGPDNHRQILHLKYCGRFSERFDLGASCTYVPNKRTPIYRWFKYKEGFSKGLVDRILREHWRLSQGSVIFDPFVGAGTTLLAAQQLGYRSLGTEIMPISVFVTEAKLCASYDRIALTGVVRKILDTPYTPAQRKLPDVKIIRLAFDEATQDELIFFRETIAKLDDEPQATRNFLMLGLLSILEDVSSTSKDGQFLRLVNKECPPIRVALEKRYMEMLSDLMVEEELIRDTTEFFPASVYQADARALPFGAEFDASVDAVITSPPYLNRYDYSRTYALELLFLFADDFETLKKVRHSLLRSHIESRPAPTNNVNLPALDEILNNLSTKSLNNVRIPIMIKGYFEDMFLVISELFRMCKRGARVALVVANARFGGELTPVDLILSELAESVGFVTDAIWITRYKGNSSQQMGRYGRVPVRESIVFWRKP